MRATLTSKGQITIPKPIRDRLRLRRGSQVEFVEERGAIVLRRPMTDDPVARLYGVLGRPESTDRILDEMRGPAQSR